MKFLKELQVSEEQRAHIMNMCKMFHVDVQTLSEQYRKVGSLWDTEGKGRKEEGGQGVPKDVHQNMKA